MTPLRQSLILMFALSLAVPAASIPQQNNRTKDGGDGIILFCGNYSFILKEPSGWVLDTTAGANQGMNAVLYRKGSSWEDGTAVMYIRVVPKNKTDEKTIEQVIQNDIDRFKEAGSGTTVASMPSITTRDKKSAIVKNFFDAQNKNHEAVAFIDEPKAVVIGVLTSRSKEEYDKSLADFKTLIESYFFVSELVNPK